MTASQYKDAERMEHVGQSGRAAWTRLKKHKDWNDWMIVGEALITGKHIAMTGAGTNKPEGKGYCMLFNQWLHRYKLHEIDKPARAQLIKVMENRAEIEEYRATLTLSERLVINHPTVMMRKWKKATKVTEPKEPKQKAPDARVEAMQAHIEELEASRPTTLEAARKAYGAFLFDMTHDQVMAELLKLKCEIGLTIEVEIPA